MTARFFILRPNDPPDEEGRRPLRLIITRGRGRRIGAPVGISVRPQDWLQKDQRVRKGVAEAASINGSLQRLRNSALALALDYPNDDELKAALLDRVGRTPRKPEPTFMQRYDAFLSDKALEVKPSTMMVFKTLRKHLVGFLPNDLEVKAIDSRLLPEFQQYLLGKGINNNTVNKYVKRVRTFMHWMVEHDIIEAAPRVKGLKTAHNDVVRLTLAELAALRAADLTGAPPAHTAARDVFMLSAMTGLRFGDCMALEWDRVGDDALFVNEGKTGRYRRIPLTDAARQTLEKYRGKRRPLPKISNQKANVAIRAVAKAAGIDAPVVLSDRRGGETESETVPKHEALTMHAGRRTFISLMLESGVSTKEMLGITHTDLRSLQRYAAASEVHLRDSMARTFDGVAI